MDKAKSAVSGFLSKAGHHDTTVHESVAPAVTNEIVNEQRREEQTTAIDREVHQDHYHTSVQDVHDREVLPEQHHHKMAAVEHRTHDHRDVEGTKHRIAQEAAQFKDSTVRAPTQHTTHAAPSVAGEHVHHHVHETIQPVIHKDTVEQHVVHTTIPIHETHHSAAQHHSTSALPAISMADFKKQGGIMSGRDERVDHFSGEPKNIDKSLGSTMSPGHHGSHEGLTSTTGTGSGYGSTGHSGISGIESSTTSGPHNSSLMNKADPRVDSDRDGRTGLSSGTTGTGTGLSSTGGHHTGSGLTGTGSSTTSSGVTGSSPYSGSGVDSRVGTGSTGVGSGLTSGSSGLGSKTTGSGMGTDGHHHTSGSSNTTTGTKPSLLDRLNPMKDSNGDGQKGFMK